MTEPTVAPDLALVRALLREQAPSLADRDLRPSASSGSSNWVFRLGDDLAVRLPRSDEYVADLGKERRWLPRLAPHLTRPVPTVVVAGEPTDRYPRPWSVVTWVPGHNPGHLTSDRQQALASDLGAFLRSLHSIDPDGAPVGPEVWGYRCGEPVTDEIDRWAHVASERLSDTFHPGAVLRAWERVRDVPAASAPPRWVHADVSSENILVDDTGLLSGVIDFGSMGVGDPAVDLLYAWSLFDADARPTFRRAAGADDAMWARARAWAFVGPGLLTIAHYGESMPQRTRALTAMVESIAHEVGIALR